MKKKLALALVFVMGLSFTACGKTTVSDSTNEAVSGGVQSTDTNEDKESSGKSDKTTITFINGFTGGFGICLGQRCGARDERGMRKSIAVSTILSIAFAVVLTVLCCVLSHQIIRWMKIPADIAVEAYAYMFVVLLGTGATVFYNMIF